MKKSSIAAVLAGCFWGSTGLFTRRMTEMHLSPMQILLLKELIAAVCFGIMLLMIDPKLFKIKRRDLWLFIALGIAGQLLFSFFYFNAINMMSVSTACILLYLSPAFVVLMAHFLFKDKVGLRGVIAVVLCVLGCAFVSGFGGSVTVKGIVFGLGSAICFALINILDRAILTRGYSITTVNFYLCFIAFLGSLILVNKDIPATFSTMFASGSNFLYCFLNAIVTAFLSYIFFSYALAHEESGKVSILASSEPVMASLISVIVFREPFGILSVVGILLVLGGIVLMNTKGTDHGIRKAD